MACNWLLMTSSGEDNWPWEFGSAHRQKKNKNRGAVVNRALKKRGLSAKRDSPAPPDYHSLHSASLA